MKARQRRDAAAENHLGEGDTGAEGGPLGVALSPLTSTHKVP